MHVPPIILRPIATRDRRYSPLRDVSRHVRRAGELPYPVAEKIFTKWVAGASHEEIAAKENLTVDKVKSTIRYHVRILHMAMRRWKRAEMRCCMMTMELRLFRMSKEPQPDRPLESLDPPKRWLRWFHEVGIETVNQLRAVDEMKLSAYWSFPLKAIDWAVLKLDQMGLSHALRKPQTRLPRSRKESLRTGKLVKV